ncbi:MAG: TonB-dependent receptor [Candidatus Omnitrophota bacterium]
MRLIRFISFFALLVTIAVGAEAAAGETSTIELQPIVITPRRTPVGLSATTENVIVINEEEISRLPARDLGEVLGYTAGVDIDPRQGFGRATSISIQGSDSRHVRVMIDGIPLNNQASGEVDPSRYSIENAKRIEVIKGSASSIWGSSLGGVINIITKDTGDTLIPKGNYTTSFAEFGTKKDTLDLSGKLGQLGYYVFGSLMESGGKDSRDDVIEKKTFGKLSYDFKDAGKLTASFGYNKADVNSGVWPDGTWWGQPYRIHYGKAGWEAELGATAVSAELKHSRQDIITEIYLDAADQEPFSTIKSKDALYQLSLNSTTHIGKDDLLVLGFDSDWDNLKSTYLTKAKGLNVQAPYANYALKLEPWDFNFGLRYDHTSEFGDELSPSLGAIYHVKSIPDTLVRAGVSRAFNAPPLLWKYYDFSLSGLTINPDITPERARVYELGLESMPLPELWLKLSLYRADVSDAISNAQSGSGQWYKKNFEKFRRQGAELQFNAGLFGGLSLFGGGAFNDIEDRATRQTVEGGGKPRYSYDLGLSYNSENGLNVLVRGYYNYWNEPASSEPNDRKMLCDIKISQKFKNADFFLNVHNFTNSKYWRDYYFPVPQRYFEGGVTFKW